MSNATATFFPRTLLVAIVITFISGKSYMEMRNPEPGVDRIVPHEGFEHLDVQVEHPRARHGVRRRLVVALIGLVLAGVAVTTTPVAPSAVTSATTARSAIARVTTSATATSTASESRTSASRKTACGPR